MRVSVASIYVMLKLHRSAWKYRTVNCVCIRYW